MASAIIPGPLPLPFNLDSDSGGVENLNVADRGRPYLAPVQDQISFVKQCCCCTVKIFASLAMCVSLRLSVCRSFTSFEVGGAVMDVC